MAGAPETKTAVLLNYSRTSSVLGSPLPVPKNIGIKINSIAYVGPPLSVPPFNVILRRLADL